jgi:hypothetical protein
MGSVISDTRSKSCFTTDIRQRNSRLRRESSLTVFMVCAPLRVFVSNLRLKLPAWTKTGIAGRGVLLDYAKWAEKHSISYSVFDGHSIPVAQLETCAKEQNVAFKHGDILLVRIGWTKTYHGLNKEERDALPHRSPVKHTGIEKSKTTARWLWDMAFSACGSDASGLEKWPIDLEDPDANVDGLHLHEVLLGGWGMPIGTVIMCFTMPYFANTIRRRIAGLGHAQC